MPSREQESREGGKRDSRSLMLLTHAIQKNLARGELLHMHIRVIATNQFLKHATFFLSLGTISLFFGFCVFCLELAPVPEKAPLLLRPPAPFSLETAHERERGRESKKERERGGECEEGREGHKTQKRERFRDGKGEEGGGQMR